MSSRDCPSEKRSQRVNSPEAERNAIAETAEANGRNESLFCCYQSKLARQTLGITKGVANKGSFWDVTWQTEFGVVKSSRRDDDCDPLESQVRIDS